jgi:Zn-dependent metalloprotease
MMKTIKTFSEGVMKSRRNAIIAIIFLSAVAFSGILQAASGQVNGNSGKSNTAASQEIEQLLGTMRGPNGAVAGQENGESARTAYKGGYLRSLGVPAGHVFAAGKVVKGNPRETAKNFITERGKAFGVVSPSVDFAHKKSKKKNGRNYEKFSQTYAGIPVFGGEMTVQLDDAGGVQFVLSDIMTATGDLDRGKVSVVPSISASDAVFLAIDLMRAEHPAIQLQNTTPQLMIYQPEVVGNTGSTHLVWYTVVKSVSVYVVDEVVLIDAHTGEVALRYTQIKNARNREVYDSNSSDQIPGTLERAEGDPASGIVDVDTAYDYLGDTYDFYFNENGRDSIDNAGMTMIATVRYCPDPDMCPFQNAFWNGTQMVFGEGFTADDVTAHELTHGVTQYESNLIYMNESGAINESFSDMWGEWIDLVNGQGNDDPSVRWLMGEDIPGMGAIRDMSNPPAFGHPDSKCSSFWYEGPFDNGGVHWNSGVGNKLCYLLTDGDTFMDVEIEGMGIPMVADLMYECQANLLTVASDYADFHAALTQAAVNLGWTEEEQWNLEKACLSTELSKCFDPADLILGIVPDPMEWDVDPVAVGENTIYMKAVTASHAAGVQYYFDCETDPANFDAHDRQDWYGAVTKYDGLNGIEDPQPQDPNGWVDNPTYYRGDYEQDTDYYFRVRARNLENGDETEWSEIIGPITPASGLPPYPNPAQWKGAPRKVTNGRIAMEAEPAYAQAVLDNGQWVSVPVQYAFDCLDTDDPLFSSPDDLDSGWQDSTFYQKTTSPISSPGYFYQFNLTSRVVDGAETDVDPKNIRTAYMSPTPITREVPTATYPTIQRAINASNHGDTVLVHRGVYREINIDFKGKAITVKSENPEDPAIVAATVIDCAEVGTNWFHDVRRAFLFQNGESRNSVLAGITIKNATAFDDPEVNFTSWEGIPDRDFPSGLDGEDALGGAILMGSFGAPASPTIQNCVFIDCFAHGAYGDNGGNAPGVGNDRDGLPGQRGGHGGNAYGGAIYVYAGSIPLIKECEFTNCQAIGGNAGNGGNGSNGGGHSNGAPDGTPGWRGGDGGDAGSGGCAWGGAIYFEPNCMPELYDVTVSNCFVQIGEAGSAGNGANGSNAKGNARGGHGGNGGIGGDLRAPDSSGGAVYFGDNTEVVIDGCTFENCRVIAELSGDYSGGDGGDGGDGNGGFPGGFGGHGGPAFMIPPKMTEIGGVNATGGTGGNSGALNSAGGNGGFRFGQGGNPGGFDFVGHTGIFPSNVYYMAYYWEDTMNVDNPPLDPNEQSDFSFGWEWEPEIINEDFNTLPADPLPGDVILELGYTDIFDSPFSPYFGFLTTIEKWDVPVYEDPNFPGDPTLYTYDYDNAILLSTTAEAEPLTPTNPEQRSTGACAGANFYGENCKVVMRNTRVSGNNSFANHGGGELYDKGCDAEFESCVFEDNLTHYAGAVFDTDFRFEGFGGAIFADQPVRFVFNDCEFTENAAYSGGAIYCNFAPSDASDPNYVAPKLDLTGSTFTGNQANSHFMYSYGGAVYAGNSLEPYEEYFFNFLKDSRYNNFDDFWIFFWGDTRAFDEFLTFVLQVYDHYHGSFIGSYPGIVNFWNPITTQLWNDELEADHILWGQNDPVYAVSVADSVFKENQAPYGAGLYLDASVVDIARSQFTDNIGDIGVGGFVFASDAVIQDNAFYRNIGTELVSLGDQSEQDNATVDTLCNGGGLYVSNANLDLINNHFASNAVDGIGGAVFVNGPSLDWYPQNLINNLFVENSAGLQGGALVASGASDVYVQNCDFVDNAVLGQYGVGGAMVAHDAFVDVVNSIFWSSEAFYPGALLGSQIAVGDPFEEVQEYDPDYIPYSTVFVEYSDVQDGEEGIFVADGEAPWLWYGPSNIEDNPLTLEDEADPLFVEIMDPNDSSGRTFYLSQVDPNGIEPLQEAIFEPGENNPCVDAGLGTVGDLAAWLGFNAVTRTDHQEDIDAIDIGYHYDLSKPVKEYVLRTSVYVPDRLPHGILEVTTEPNNLIVTIDPVTSTYLYRFKQGTVVHLLATPEEHYRVARWIGTDSDPFYYGQTDTVTMTGYEMAQVEFELAVPRNLYVPESYDTLEDAVTAVRDGDTIILAPRPSQPYLITDPEGINFGYDRDGKAKQVHLRSTDPNDPLVVASTIIDAQGSRYVSKRAFLFNNGADPNTIIEGVTIRNAFTAVIGPSYAINTGLWPWHDGSIFGVPPEPWTADNPNPSPPSRALSGMDATGDSYGGAILIENGSSPTIRKCVFENCTVSGGIGGDGADGYPPISPVFTNVQGDTDAQSGGHSGKGTGNGYGGAIAVIDGSGPIISECQFINNRATGGWGGIPGDSGRAYNNGRYGWGGNDPIGVLYASLLYGINPEAGYGEGDGRGGAIFVDAGCKPTLTGCIFEGNYARPGYVSAGGAESPNGSAYPDPFDAAAWGEEGARAGRDGILTDYGTISGGAVFFAEEADSAVIDCNFVDGSAYDVYTYNDPPVYTRGGGVYADPNVVVHIQGCEFTDNFAGALYCSTGATLTVDDCEFTNNKTYDPDVDSTLFFYPEFTATWDLAGGITVEVDSKAPAKISNSWFTGNMTDGSGGAIRTDSDIEVTNSVFNANSAMVSGGAFYSYYALPSPDTHTIKLDFTNCEFSENAAQGLGGAGYTRTSILNLTNCFFVQNNGYSGGALYTVNSEFEMQGALVYGNTATGLIEGEYRPIVEEGLGGGIFAIDCKVAMVDSRILNNHADGVNSCGGGVCITGGQTYKELNLLNCLIAGNDSDNNGGGLSCQKNVNVEMDNCTIADNISGSQRGGGIFVDNTSTVSLTHSIVSRNTGYGIYEQLATGATNPGGDSSAAYTLFNGNSIADLFDAQTNQGLSAAAASGYTNIFSGDPLFTDGPLDGYYLTQTSPAVNAGNMTAVDAMLDTYTTDPAGMLDQGILDLGYHYDDPMNIPFYTLTAQIQDGGGTVDPASGFYIRGAIVPLLANVDDEYFLMGWSGGTVNDNSKEASNVVLMTRDRDILVLVRLRRTLNVGSSSQYDTLGDALDDAQDGDIILVAPGNYVAASQFPSSLNNIPLDGKIVTIAGANPDDESVVRATVFRDFNFDLANLDERSIIEGLTFEQGRMYLVDADLIIRNCVFKDSYFRPTVSDPVHIPPVAAGTDGYNGDSILGGALIIRESSPRILNCIFEDNAVEAANGENGFAGAASHPDGGDGGWPSPTYGGAVYCGLSSEPTFIGCTFTGNRAIGGVGGNGANFVVVNGVPYDGGRGGGWLYDDTGEQYLVDRGWDGWLFGSPENESKSPDYNYKYAEYEGRYDPEVWSRWFNLDDPSPLFDAWRYSAYGGAVYCEMGTKATFEDCVFEENNVYGALTGMGGALPLNEPEWPDRPLNMPTAGGAVFAAYDSDLIFENCQFRNNTADTSTVELPHTVQTSFGGAVAYQYNCRVTFTDCEIQGNTATVGGGIYGYESPVEIEVYGYDSPTTIVDCNIFGNEAYIGAGIFLDDEAAVISGTLVHSNHAKAPDATTVPGENPDDPPVVVDPIVTVTGEGAGLYAHVLDLQIRDSMFFENKADLSGGGLLLSGTVDRTANIFNCLFAENTAGRDGSGASVNWMSRVRFGNCTFADNDVLGIFREVETGEFIEVTDPDTGEITLVPEVILVQDFLGSGGGLAVSYDSIAEVIDSIFWGNTADQGESIYIGAGTASEPRPSELTISYSDVANYPSANAIYVENDCPDPVINQVFSDLPDFLTLPDAGTSDVALRYYLDQETSPAVDKGSDFASAEDIGLSNYTTSIYGASDKGLVDLGFHYKQAGKTSCRLADLILSGKIDLSDWAIFASEWISLPGTCGEGNNWCSGADLNFDTEVDAQDLMDFGSCWLDEDKDAPFPGLTAPSSNVPAEWEVEPMAPLNTFDSITMSASLHHDLWFPDDALKYYFDCTGPSNGPDSGWISEREWTLTIAKGLDQSRTYEYVVRVKDPAGNETLDSEKAKAMAAGNVELPQARWLTPPFVTDNQFAIQMEALAYEDYGTVGISVQTLPPGYVIMYEFWFTGTAPGGESRSVEPDPVYVDQGMVEGQTYSYRTRMVLCYDKGDGSDPVQTTSASEWSEEAFVIAVEPDLFAPIPNPAQHASGSPSQIFVASKGIYYHVVTAVAATDDSDVEYRFVDTTNSSYSSGGSADPDGLVWRNADNVLGLTYPNGTAQMPEQYWAPRGNKNTGDGWYILVRDRSPNQNTTAPSQTLIPPTIP